MPKPSITKIVKRDNNFQRLEVLIRNREKRGRYSEFLVEGFIPLERLVQFPWKVRAWVYSSKRGLSDRSRNIILNGTQQAQHFDLTPDLLAEISRKEQVSELLAVVEMPSDSSSRIRKSDCPLYVVFDRPQNPGNLGTNIRTCDAMGVDAAFMIGHSVDLYDPETVRASVGSLFALPVLRKESWDQVVNDLGTEVATPLQIVGTSAHGKVLLQDCNLAQPTVLLIGNEKTGLSSTLLAASDPLVTISQQGSATSLNVSCATSIILYEVQRQRMSKNQTNPQRQ